jgi:hypothetical protein
VVYNYEADNPTVNSLRKELGRFDFEKRKTHEGIVVYGQINDKKEKYYGFM